MSDRGDLLRRLEKGDYHRDVVVFSFSLVGVSRAGVDPDGPRRPALEAALRRALAAEAGAGLPPDCVSLAITSGAAAAPEAKQFGRGAPDGLNEGNGAWASGEAALKGAGLSEAGAHPQPTGGEDSPAALAARSSAEVRCVLLPPAAAKPGDVAAALKRRLTLPLNGQGPATGGPLLERVGKELAAAKDLEAVSGHAVKVADVSRPEVRSAFMPEVHLDKKHGIPAKVFRLFDDLQVLADAWAVKGLSDAPPPGPADAGEIAWALRKVAEVCRDPQLEKLFMLTIANLLRKDRRSCHRWVATIAPSSLRQLLVDNPVRERICGASKGVFEQTGQLQAYALQCKLCVALALAAADAMKRWDEEMAPEDKSWLADAAEKLATVPDMQASQARSLWDRSACRFLIIDLVCRNSSSMDAALAQLRRCPKDVICSRFKALWRDGVSKEGSFLYLFPHFIRKKECAATDSFLAMLASAFASDPGSDLAGAVRAFLEDAEVPAVVRRDFVINFVSACRLPRQAIKIRQRSTRCCCLRSPQPLVDEEEEELAVPSLEGFDVLVWEVILREFVAREAEIVARGPEDPAAARDLAELFEALLLVAPGDGLAAWAQDKLENDQVAASDATRFLNTVAWRPLAELLRTFTSSARPAWYVEERVKDLVEGKRPWAYDLSKAGKRFLDVARLPAKREPEDFSQLVWAYFKLDFALGAGSSWTFMEHLEEGSSGLAPRLARLAPVGSSLRQALAEDIRRSYGETSLQASEVQGLLKYLGFFDTSFQRCLWDTGVLCSLSAQVAVDEAPDVVGVPPATGFLASMLEAVAKLMGRTGGSGDWPVEQALQEIVGSCCGARVAQRLFLLVTQVVRSAQLTDPDFNLGHLLECARELGKAGTLLAFKLERRGAPLSLLKGTEQAIQNFLRQTPASGWPAVFRTLDTVIFALEYMGKEDLGLAFSQFEAECRSTQNEALIELIACVRRIYQQPLAGDRPENISPNMDVAEFIRSASPPLERRVAWRGTGFEPADWERVLEIAGAAAECMRQRYSVLMLPHHTQMITLLMFAIRACGARAIGAGGNRMPKTMLARVGTGEGKSLIIAMIASFVAKRGLRAHVINDNRVLSRRDFEASKALFEALGLTSSYERGDIKNKACQIVYCTGDDVERSCLDELIEGHVEEYEEGLKEAVLIVDEVDGLIFDKGVVTAQSFEDREFSDWVNTWLNQLETRGEIERDWDDFRSQGECTMRIQGEVEDAWKELSQKKEGVDYVIRGGIPYMLDPKTNLVREDTWSLWMEVLKRQRSEGAYSVKYKYTKAILCRLQCFMSYSCIFGLTGSLGQSSEKEYLSQHYEAATFNVPFFLDTCRDERPGAEAERRRPLEVGDRILVRVENGGGEAVVELDRVDTKGLVGSIAARRNTQPEEFLVEFSDGRALWFEESWLERGTFQGKRPPRLVEGPELLPDLAAQEAAVVELAAGKCAEVPVLVLAKDPEAVARIAAALRERLGDDGGEQRAVIELLHDPARPQEFVELVQLATEPLDGTAAAAAAAADAAALAAPAGSAAGDGMEQAASYPLDGGEEDSMKAPLDDAAIQLEGLGAPEVAPQGQVWRITVSTAEGGRGHDYRVVDPAIDERGGLLLILTWVPWSEREWIQFLGRTARQDHAGQYAVLLNAQDEQVIAGTASREEGESGARAILRHGEAQTANLLQGKGGEITKGRLMHKLTSRFWTLHKVQKTSKRQDWDWKRLCENYLDFTADAIQHVFSRSVVPPKELVLGFAKMDKGAPLRPGLAELTCGSCGAVNLFPKPSVGQEMPTVRCGNCGETE